MLRDRERKNKDFVAALIMDTHPGIPKVRDIWRQFKAILELDPIGKELCKKSRNVVTTFRRGKYVS